MNIEIRILLLVVVLLAIDTIGSLIAMEIVS